jgi:hypothetical protein
VGSESDREVNLSFSKKGNKNEIIPNQNMRLDNCIVVDNIVHCKSSPSPKTISQVFNVSNIPVRCEIVCYNIYNMDLKHSLCDNIAIAICARRFCCP